MKSVLLEVSRIENDLVYGLILKRKRYGTVKKLMKIAMGVILTIFIIILVLLGCIVYVTDYKITNVESEKRANDSLPNTDNAAENYEAINTDDITENRGITNETTDMYNHILEEYRDMVQNDFYTDLLDSDTYDSSFGEHIGLEIRTHKKAIFYAFYDIDGNGTKELIIAGGEDGVGVANPAFAPCNYDIYGYDGTNVLHIFPEMDFGYRTNFSLYENGIIEVYYSGSAAESGVDFYKIESDGFTPELVDSFSVVWHLEGEEPVCTYFQKGNEITEEEYKTNMQSYIVTLTAGLDWIEIY